MKVVLLKDVKGSGKAGDVIEVSEGYARNFLIPKGIGAEADKQILNDVKLKKGAQAHQKEVEKTQAKEIAEKINKLEIQVNAKAGGNGKLFGAITNKEIADVLDKSHGIKIDKKKISLSDSIKLAGAYKVNVKVYPGIAAVLTVNVTVE